MALMGLCFMYDVVRLETLLAGPFLVIIMRAMVRRRMEIIPEVDQLGAMLASTLPVLACDHGYIDPLVVAICTLAIFNIRPAAPPWIESCRRAGTQHRLVDYCWWNGSCTFWGYFGLPTSRPIHRPAHRYRRRRCYDVGAASALHLTSRRISGPCHGDESAVTNKRKTS